MASEIQTASSPGRPFNGTGARPRKGEVKNGNLSCQTDDGERKVAECGTRNGKIMEDFGHMIRRPQYALLQTVMMRGGGVEGNRRVGRKRLS